MLQALAELMVQSPEVQRWLMKIDDEHLGRGHAYLDVAAIPAVVTALQLYSQTLEQIPGLLHSFLVTSTCLRIRSCCKVTSVSNQSLHSDCSDLSE